MKPLILEYATERKVDEKDEILYEYDFTESMNMIQTKNKKIPIIDSNSDNVELLTKSEQSRERDDDFNLMLELQTKTLVSREQDDENFNNN